MTGEAKLEVGGNTEEEWKPPLCFNLSLMIICLLEH